METTLRVAALCCLSAASGFAGTWTGYLVNSKCFASLERNVNPDDTQGYVDHDRNWEIRYCSPNAKTKLFAVVEQDGTAFNLDAPGDAKAIDLLRKTGKKRYFGVLVTGERNKDTVKVDSISTVP